MFRRRKKEAREEEKADSGSQDIAYSQDELSTIDNLLTDFNEAPGQVSVPAAEQPETAAPEDTDFEPGLDEESEDFGPGSEDVNENLDDLGDLDDLGEIGDLDNLESDAGLSPTDLMTEEGDQLEHLDELPGLPGAETEEPAATPEEPSSVDNDFNFDMEAGLTEDLDDLTQDVSAGADEGALDLPEGDLGLSDEDLGLSDADLGLGDLGNFDDLEGAGEPAAPEMGGDDFAEPAFSDSEADFNEPAEPLGEPETASFDSDSEDFGLGFDEAAQFEGGAISLDDVSPEIAFGTPRRKDDLDLSSELSELASEQATDEALPEATLQALRKNIRNFQPLVRHGVIDTILGKRLPDDKISELIEKIAAGESENSIKEFLESGLGASLTEAIESPEPDRKVIVSRDQYTEKGLKRQARMIKWTRFAAVAALVLLTLSSAGYLFIYKNLMYKRHINMGKEALSAQPLGDPEIEEAERHFEEAISYFPERNTAYLQFADAYRKRGLYENAFEKLFGKISMVRRKEALRYENREIDSPRQIWSLFTKVPIVSYGEKSDTIVLINNVPWRLEKKGAYLIAHLDNEKDEAIILYALGQFHSSPARRFTESPYRNNRLGIDYYQRILNFNSKTPLFGRDDFISKAVLGIGNVYYNQKNYYKAHDYFDKIIQNDPKDIEGQAGMMRALIQIYKQTNDPRLIIQQHSMIKHNLGIERKLPMYILAKLASFYIDLPGGEDLRITYNVPPVDKVNDRTLKSRASELLNAIYNKKEKDIYGNKISGETYAEGFYQRGRYYRNVTGELRMAMMQFEYAYNYNPGHFMALNDRAEILMELHDYDGAIRHLKLAEKEITQAKLNLLGDSPEDETLLEADLGRIYLNMAKALYLSTVKGLQDTDDWLRIQETSKFDTGTEHGREALAAMLDRTDSYFDRAEEIGVRDEYSRAELAYFRGWSYYIRNNYKRALFYWQSIPPTMERDHPNLELAKSYALYYLGTTDAARRKQYLESALSYLFYLQSELAPKTELVGVASVNNKQHLVLYSRLAIIENNIGAIYELMNNEELAIKHYWKSIEYSRQIQQENEIAHLNLRLSFKRSGLELDERYPVIMDFISPLMTDEVL